MNKDLFVYLSGPMTPKDGFSIEDNVVCAVNIYWDFLRCGIPAFCPHLSGIYPTAWTVLNHGEWIEYDFAVIDRCTHLVTLPRYESSAGSLLEVEYAKKIGIPVVSCNEMFALAENLALP